MQLARDGQWKVEPMPIIGPYNVQRFRQWSPEDAANWYVVRDENTKLPHAMYPTMGRAHINYGGINRLIFGTEPRALFKTVNYGYAVVGNTVYQIDANYNATAIPGSLNSLATPVWFAFLVVGQTVYAVFVDDQNVYVFQEGTITGLQQVTDPNCPGGTGSSNKPGYVAAFGNRIVVSVANSSQFFLSAVNLVGTGQSTFQPANCFTTSTGAVFAQEEGIIRQIGVLNNTLYFFLDYRTGVWSNIQSVFTNTNTAYTFPWKKNTTYDWNFGIANPTSLDIDFGMIVFLARNSDGLLQFMMSNGGQPERISTKAIDTLLQAYTNQYGSGNPFLSSNSNGFLYQYENTIFYRMSGGPYLGQQILDQEQSGNSIEYSFETKTWHRLIETNGERNRVQAHVYYNFKHLVTVTGDNTVYDMSGQYYYNEDRNDAETDEQATDAYIAYPFRYERVTPIVFDEKDYSEFETEYVQIDFVWGDSNILYSIGPFANAQFMIAEQALAGQPQYIIAEQPDPGGQPVFVLAEAGNTPALNELIYNSLYKPSIELLFSDDGGISYSSADVRVFSQQGQYSWRMRWYQLGPSRNRVYKLVCVSPVPIVILGAVMSVRRMSGGAA